MKYWLLTTEYPPFFGGGISTYAYHTCCMFSEMGHDLTVFVSDNNVKSIVSEKRKEARVVRFNPNLNHSQHFLGDVTRISYEFANIVKETIDKEGKPDVIEVQDYNGIGYFLLQFKACLFEWCQDIPIVVTIHSPSFLYFEYNQTSLYKRPNFWIGEMERFCIQASDLAISPSQYLIDELKKRFEINTSNLHVLPNPYRFKKDQKEISPAHILNNSIYFYGKLSPQKGTFKILEEFKLLWDKGFKEVFTMIGGQDIVFQPESKTMGEIVKTQYADYIKHGLLKLKDKISPNERESVLSDSIIFIVPSIVDNLPYVVLELMSLGKIVIVSKQGGQAEIVSDGEDGFVFDFNEPGSFEKKLFKALKSTFEERKQLVEAAIKKIENNYSYEKLSSLKFKLIENIISKNDKREKFTFIRSLGEKPFADISFKKNGVLSVVIPYYNLGAYINEAINSVLNSTHQHIEIIIINDGSDDEASIKELDNFRNHPQIKIIDKQNTGLADSRNKGAELSNGEFLAFLDADDKVAPDYYEKAIKILCHYKNVFFVGAWTQYFGNSKNIWPTFNPEPPLLLTHNMINSSALIYKKEAFLKAGKNDKDFKIGLEDYESVVSMIAYGLNGVAIPEILFYYRVRKNSMIKGVDMQVRANYYNQIKQKHPLLFLNFEKDISSLIEKNSSPLSMDNSTYDDFPFQNVPVLNIIVRRGIQVVKSNSWLKIQVFRIKRIIRRLT